MLLKDEQYRAVWKKVDSILHFCPSVDTWVIPFTIREPYVVFDIHGAENAGWQDSDKMIAETFVRCTAPGERLYALDWQHSAFLFDPRIPEEQKSIYLGENPYLPGHGLYAHFPGYYPDGDYYFFIEEHFRFGYLSHPWREEVWIFGSRLIAEFESIYKQLGWTKKESI